MESFLTVLTNGHTAEQVTRLIVNLIQLFVGVPGNCLILRVYWTKTMKTSTHVVIMALAWADLAVCLMALPDTIERGLELTGGEIAVYVFFVINTFKNMTIGFSVFITLIIAADLYDCICRANKRFFSYKRAKIVVWIVFLIAFIVAAVGMIAAIIGFQNEIQILTLAIQLFFLTGALVMIILCYSAIYRTISKHVKVTFASGPDASRIRPNEKYTSRTPAVVSKANKLHVSATGKDASTRDKETCTVDHDVISLKSVASLSNAKGRPVKLTTQVETEDGRVAATKNDQRTEDCDVSTQEQIVSRGRPQKNAHTSDLQRKTTRMLFITSVIFLLTWLPYWVFVVISFAEYVGANVSLVARISIGEIAFISYINNAVNPFIYGIANRRFRKDCREEFRSMKLC